MAASPTQRTLAYYRELGYEADVAERWIEAVRQRRDLFGFIDIVVLTDDKTIGVQATSTSNMSSRVRKIVSHPAAAAWLANPDREVIVIGWKKYAKAINRKFWRPTITPVTKEMLHDVAAARGQ
jgi:hypothetical protein